MLVSDQSHEGIGKTIDNPVVIVDDAVLPTEVLVKIVCHANILVIRHDVILYPQQDCGENTS
jgi:hypothetical protein